MPTTSRGGRALATLPEKDSNAPQSRNCFLAEGENLIIYFLVDTCSILLYGRSPFFLIII